jgi:hypothetical protein
VTALKEKLKMSHIANLGSFGDEISTTGRNQKLFGSDKKKTAT